MPVTSVLECYKCQSPLVAEVMNDKTVVKCEVCGAENGPGAKKEFWEPTYISEQMQKIGSTRQYHEFVMKIEPEKILSSGEDFLSLLRLVLQKPFKPDQIKGIILKGIEIGKLAEAADAFIKAGGFFAITKKEMEDADKASNEFRESQMPGE